MKKFDEKNVTENPLYHDTWTLLKKYRDVVWSLELSVQHVRAKFEIEYGTSIEDFLDSVYLAGADLAGSDKEIMQDVYTQIMAISTIAAIVTASVALLLMNFSRSGRTVDESRAWLKRICITWAILNGLGFIMAYVTPLFAGGQWTG